jgi:hypothetical protein
MPALPVDATLFISDMLIPLSLPFKIILLSIKIAALWLLLNLFVISFHLIHYCSILFLSIIFIDYFLFCNYKAHKLHLIIKLYSMIKTKKE